MPDQLETEAGSDPEYVWDERHVLVPADRVPRRVRDINPAGDIL